MVEKRKETFRKFSLICVWSVSSAGMRHNPFQFCAALQTKIPAPQKGCIAPHTKKKGRLPEEGAQVP
jgi:hypothetical protein